MDLKVFCIYFELYCFGVCKIMNINCVLVINIFEDSELFLYKNDIIVII